MKNVYVILMALVFGLSSCDSFLSKEPDNRLRPDDLNQVQALLVNAYPEGSWYFVEWMTDNVGKTLNNMMLQHMTEIYTFQKVRSKFQDTPTYYWTSAYRAVAHANQALISLEEIECTDAERKALQAEAYLCRSYAHFMLVNLFAPHYDAATAASTPGVPYVKDMEDKLIVQYERESVASVYKKAEEDLLEGIRLKLESSENYSSALKYHFSLEAAYAYATRFYLFMGNYDKVIEYADLVLGQGYNSKYIRDYTKINMGHPTTNALNFCAYDESSNIMLARKEVFADAFYQVGYRMTYEIFEDIYFRAEDDVRCLQLWVGNETRTSFYVSKFYSALEDESYAYEIMPLLRGEEVFLNRLEALVQNDALTEAEEQLRQFVENRYSGSDQSSFSYDYYKSEYQTMLAPDLSEKDLLMKMILDERRREFVKEVLRWFDMKSFNLFPITHEDINGNVYTLTLDKAALEIPDEAIINGLEPNYKEDVTNINL